MKITHPVKGYSGYVTGPRAFGLHFLAGEAHAKAADIPPAARSQWEADGFQFVDERRQTAQDGPNQPSEGDQPGE